MIIERIYIPSVDVNTYLLYDSQTRDGVIIDPGGEFERIKNIIEDNEITLNYILLTHSHADHIGATEELRQEFNVEIAIHKAEEDMLQEARHNLSPYILGKDCEIQADLLLEDGDILKVGSEEIEVIYTPGHSPGGVSYKVGNNVFVGDALFKGSIGRTDLYEGDHSQLVESIKERILSLDDDTILYPGHGPETTVKIEKMTNPFVQ